jgi:hypothetical protein
MFHDSGGECALDVFFLKKIYIYITSIYVSLGQVFKVIAPKLPSFCHGAAHALEERDAQSTSRRASIV